MLWVNGRLVVQTHLLATLLASLSVLPAAICLGFEFQDWVAVLINLRYGVFTLSLLCIIRKSAQTSDPERGCLHPLTFADRTHTQEEIYLAGTAIGATFGAYIGALPIPLDWDRPWQVRQQKSTISFCSNIIRKSSLLILFCATAHLLANIPLAMAIDVHLRCSLWTRCGYRSECASDRMVETSSNAPSQARIIDAILFRLCSMFTTPDSGSRERHTHSGYAAPTTPPSEARANGNKLLLKAVLFKYATSFDFAISLGSSKSCCRICRR